MVLEPHEHHEIRQIVSKYAMRNRAARMVIEQASVIGRLNKSELQEAGLSRKQIEDTLERLREKLKDYHDA